MPLTRDIEKINNFHFYKPMRAIFSGSSQSGKTYLIGKILENQMQLFGSEFEQIKYFYPEYLDECPVQWHNSMKTPISYESGFPRKSDIMEMPEGSLIIIDDNMKKVVDSELMRQFFNVISGKRNLSIIVVTQNYFTQGKFSRDIRNSSNIVCLFRNCAEKAYQAAEAETFSNSVYPYIFIDQSQRSQLSSYRVYSDILSKIRVAFSANGMKGYILNELDFKRAFSIIQEKPRSVKAILDEDSAEKLSTKKSKRKRKLKKLRRSQLKQPE